MSEKLPNKSFSKTGDSSMHFTDNCQLTRKNPVPGKIQSPFPMLDLNSHQKDRLKQPSQTNKSTKCLKFNPTVSLFMVTLEHSKQYITKAINCTINKAWVLLKIPNRNKVAFNQRSCLLQIPQTIKIQQSIQTKFQRIQIWTTETTIIQASVKLPLEDSILERVTTSAL